MPNHKPIVLAGLAVLILAIPLFAESLFLPDFPMVKQPCLPSGSNLCLNQGRFKVEVEWKDFQGRIGSGQVVPFGSDDSGLLWFFDPANWEMLVKILDGCGLNGHFWVFSAATTNVEYALRVTDMQADTVKSYLNPLGNAADALADTHAFPCSDSEPRSPLEVVLTSAEPMVHRNMEWRQKQGCVPGESNLCLNLGRFRIEIEWQDFQGNTGFARVVPFGSDDSGLVWFFAPANWEMLVKVLNGGSLNGHFWVFAAATTTVEYTLRVTDTVTGTFREYFNPLGTAAAAITDTEAFVWTNHPPVAGDVSVTTSMNRSVDIPIVGEAATDPDGQPDPLIVSGVAQPAYGATVAIAPGAQSISFHPDLGFSTNSQPVSFSYTVFDGEDSATGDVEVEVTPLPDPSCSEFVATPSTISLGESSTLSWTQSNGVSATINGDPVPLDGPYAVSPTATETYTLTINGEPGTTPATCGPVTVTVLTLPPSGIYSGTTSQGLPIDVAVSSDGRVTEWLTAYDCGFFSAIVWTFYSSCPIVNNHFHCGATNCAAFEATLTLEGTFTGTMVSGTISVAHQPNYFSPCCQLTLSWSGTLSKASATLSENAVFLKGDRVLTHVSSEICWDPSFLDQRPLEDACFHHATTLVTDEELSDP